MKFFCVILEWQIHVIHLSKPVKCTTLRVNTNINYGFGVIMVYQCRFIDCNKCTSLVGNIDLREAMLDWGRAQGVYGNSLYFILNFAENLKLL